MKIKKILSFLVFICLTVVTVPSFSQQKPPSQGKHCEKFSRGPDGKIVRQVVPCPSSK